VLRKQSRKKAVRRNSCGNKGGAFRQNLLRLAEDLDKAKKGVSFSFLSNDDAVWLDKMQILWRCILRCKKKYANFDAVKNET
jgi:hypothetical protein